MVLASVEKMLLSSRSDFQKVIDNIPEGLTYMISEWREQANGAGDRVYATSPFKHAFLYHKKWNREPKRVD